MQIDLNIFKEKFPDVYPTIVNPKNNTLLARKAGEHINQHFDDLKKHISIPIIQPTLEHLKYEDEVGNIDLIILVATNQEKPHDLYTCFYAEIIKNTLPKNTSLFKELKYLK